VLGLGSSLVKGGKVGRAYVKDGLKLYMPYRGSDAAETQFVGTGSTSFDGGDYVTTGLSSSGYSALTVSTWAKADSFDSYNAIASQWRAENAAESSWILETVSSNIKFYVDKNGSGADFAGGDTTISAGTWYHFTATWDGLTVKLYINGVAESTTLTSTTSIGVPTTNAVIGALYNSGGSAIDNGFYKGSMKNVAIWNRALTATEVQNVMYKQYAEVSGRLASGLVSWWALEETATSTTTADSHGSNTGTLGDGSTSSTYPTFDSDIYGGDTPVKPRAIDNAPTVQADAIGAGSASFDGTDDYITIADDSSLDITSDFSITCWVKADSFDSNVDGIIAKTVPSTGDGYGLYADTAADKIKFFSQNYNSDYAETGALSVNTWYHIAGTFSDSGNLNSIYVDGVLTDTSAETTAMAANNDPLEIGRVFQDNNSNLNGNISQVGIWDAVLTQAQIQSIMEKTYEELTASEKTNLVSYWALDEAEDVLSFDGNNDDCKVDVAIGNLGTASVSMWIKDDSATGSAYQFLFDARGDGNGGTGYFDIYSNAVLKSSGTVYVDGSATATLATNVWKHVVVTGITIDIDEDVRFAEKYSGSSNFGGMISRVAIYNRALTSGEISAQYALGLDGDLSSDLEDVLVGYWKMDNASTVTDLSSNNNDGTISGASLVGGAVLDKTSNNNDGAMN